MQVQCVSNMMGSGGDYCMDRPLLNIILSTLSACHMQIFILLRSRVARCMAQLDNSPDSSSPLRIVKRPPTARLLLNNKFTCDVAKTLMRIT